MISRKWAFIIHLNLSLLVFSSLIAVLYFYWFPGQLFWLDGGWQGLKLVAIVDLILGPLLTLILFKPGKKGLVGDMAAIAVFQLAALGYGFHATHQQQSQGLVFADGAFTTLARSSHLEANESLRAKGESPRLISSFGERNPIHVYVEPPNKETMGSFLTDIFNGYPDPHERSDKYEELGNNLDALALHSLTQQELEDQNSWSAVATTLKEKNLQQSDVQFYRFVARYKRGIAIFDPAQTKVLVYVPIERKQSSKAVAENTES